MGDVTHTFSLENEPEVPIYGCTDPTANNYDPTATVDDESCTYDADIPGCTDPGANNYDPLATVDDGSCLYDPTAPNYIDIICATYTTGTVEYATGLFFDWYVEDCNVNTNRPVFMFLHPGGATRTNFTPVKYAKAFASRGYFGISPDFGETDPYTLAKQKQNASNMCALIRHLRANAVTYGINPLNMFIGGNSAGALTAATTNIASNEIDNGVAYWDNAINAQDDGFSSEPTATMSQSGTITPSLYTYIDPTDKPHYFYHGEDDCTMAYSQASCGVKGAVECHQKMIDEGIASTLCPYPGLGHSIGVKHDEIMLGGSLQSDGVTVDAGIVAKFAALLAP